MSYWEVTRNSHTMGIGTGKMPGRKSRALYVVNGSVLLPLAYFRSDEDAELADKMLRMLVVGREEI